MSRVSCLHSDLISITVIVINRDHIFFTVAVLRTQVGAQLEWDGRDWRTLATDDDSELYMPWLISRPGIQDFPANGPSNCRVLVIDCISYSVPYMRVLTIDEDRQTALNQKGGFPPRMALIDTLTRGMSSLLQYILQGCT